MKKTILSIFACLAISQSQAQTTDLTFDTWVTGSFGSPADVKGFASANVLVNSLPGGGSPSNPVVATKETGAGNFSQGTAGMKLTTGKLVVNPGGSGFNDTVGFAFTGNVSLAGVKTGFPYSERPDGYSFSYKAQPIATDSNYVYVYLFKGGVPRTTIAQGYKAFDVPTSSMNTASVTLTYSSSMDADSAFILISASRVRGAKLGSVFYIDDFKFYGGNVGIFERSKNDLTIQVFPNPASNFVQFSTPSLNADKIMAYDITGKLVASEQLENGKTKLSTQQLNNGIYMYSLIGKDNEVLTSGKFTVDK